MTPTNAELRQSFLVRRAGSSLGARPFRGTCVWWVRGSVSPRSSTRGFAKHSGPARATPDFRAGLASVRKFWVDGDDQRIRQQWRWRLTAAPCHESRVSNVSPGMDGRSDRFRCHRAATRHFVVSHREHACLSSGASRPRVDFLVRNERNLRAPSELRRRTIITYQQLHNRVFGACGSRGQGICAPESLIDVV